MRKILVLRGGALGDFVVTLPALAALRRRWPDAGIELAGNSTAAQLAVTRGLLDAVHSQHAARWSGLYAADALPAEFAAWLAEFDLILNFWPDPAGELARRFPLRIGQIFLSADAWPQRAPAAAHYCAPLRSLGIDTEDFSFRLASHKDGDRIAIHPGSGSPGKNWPQANWRALIATLPLPVLLILGEAEVAGWNPTSLPTSVITAICQPLETLVTHFSSCRLFLGHDSGISHLAAACGVPSLLLFGPTDPATWAPPTPRTRVLRSGPTLDAISLAEVQDTVANLLAAQR